MKARVSLYTSTTATRGNTLNAEANVKIQLSSFKPDIKEICNNLRMLFLKKKECCSSRNFLFVLENRFFI